MSLASMEKNLFNLKFAAKELERSSKKCDKVRIIINISEFDLNTHKINTYKSRYDNYVKNLV